MSENMQQCPSCGELVPIEYVVCVWCGFDLTAEQIRRSGVTIGRQEAFGRMKKVVVRPIQAFKEITLIPDIKGGRTIFYLIGLMMTLNMLAVLGKLENLSFNDPNQPEVFGFLTNSTTGKHIISFSIKFIISVMYLIVQPIVLLIIFNIIWRTAARFISTFSRTFGGKADKVKVRAVIGYSMLPVLIGWTFAYLLRLLSPSIKVVGSNTYTGIEAGVVTVATTGIGAIAGFFVIVGWIWATILAIIGVSKATRISYAEAIIVVGIPYVLFMTILL